ncbi:MAG: hypothetical protein M1823_005828 [Watsoniomyces obsoletus]|nr:MAG: hypothetical protein M1823_005828 [Watsoniomyces obsoletus]
MPLIIISGYPSSGKTQRAEQLLEDFRSRIQGSSNARIARLKVHHISDQTLGLSRTIYGDVRAEKDGRAAEFSAVERVLGRDDIVVADGLNYIKGYRYQLYCAAKAASTPSCIVHVGASMQTCREINTRLRAEDDGYPEEIFEDLLRRYEEPNDGNRWDRPLFTVLHDDSIPPFDAIWDAIIGEAKTVKPHQATVLKPATATDYLYDLDRLTQDVLSLVLSYQQNHAGEGGGQMPVADVSVLLELPLSPVSVPELQRLRRQFIALNRQHRLEKNRIKELFVLFLNEQLNKDT